MSYMGQALYRKYRSKTFDEVVGQEHITKTLAAAVKSGRISHAYLFTGPRGVGKTSVARILAREVNKLPYEGEGTHLDIIEIDAASNRRIDEIRDLRDKVHITPTSAKYKVYIIDEVHMLTREAFNALLKTLEEPPEHCIFILATTEAHKLPETIVSRTQRYNFRLVTPEVAKKHLENIAKQEKIAISDEALALLAEFGEGSFRDSISLLDQLAGGGKIDEQQVRLQLGLPKSEMINNLLESTLAGDSKQLLDRLNELRAQGIEAGLVAKMLAKEIRRRLHEGDLADGPKMLRSLAEVNISSGAADGLEIALLEIAAANRPHSQPPRPQAKPADDEPAPNEQKEEIKPAKPAPKASTVSTGGANFDLSMWEDVLERVKKEAASIYTALRLAAPELDGGVLRLAFEFPLHQKKINQAKAKDIISSAIEEISGASLSIECTVDKQAVRQYKPQNDLYKPEADEASPVEAISNIFGSAEVLES